MAFRSIVNRKEQFDWILFFSYLGLVSIGLLMIYATTYHDTSGQDIWQIDTPFGRQLLWAGVSLILLFIVYLVEWQLWESLSLVAYIGGLLMLIALLLVGTEIKGAKSWLTLGSFSIQPAEFVKFSTCLFVASFLSPIQIRLREFRIQLAVFALILIPAFLIILQPDPGSAITFLSFFILFYRKGLPTFYYVLFISVFLTIILSLLFDYQIIISLILYTWLLFLSDVRNLRLSSILVLVTMGLVTAISFRYEMPAYSIGANALACLAYMIRDGNKRSLRNSVTIVAMTICLGLLSFASDYGFTNLLKPHQQDRINVWLQPDKCDPRGSLYNLVQSKLAIGSGGFKGKGFLEGTMTKLNYVPEQSTDFIFSTIGEEQGFLGGAGVIILFFIMVMRILQISERSRHAFIKNYGYGVMGFIFLHFFINIGMTMGISPVIGIPLPFVSKGGSALMSFSIMLGVLLKMGRQR